MFYQNIKQLHGAHLQSIVSVSLKCHIDRSNSFSINSAQNRLYSEPGVTPFIFLNLELCLLAITLKKMIDIGPIAIEKSFVEKCNE